MGDERLTEQIIQCDPVFSGILIDVEHCLVSLPDGRMAPREIVRHVGGAGVVPLDAQGNVTLVRQYRVAMGRMMTEIPAGKKDSPEEDALDCARRELSEEVGLTARNWRHLITLDSSPGFLTERIRVFLAMGLTWGEPHPDTDEQVQIITIPLEEAVRRVMAGEITDGKTVCGLLMAARAI